MEMHQTVGTNVISETCRFEWKYWSFLKNWQDQVKCEIEPIHWYEWVNVTFSSSLGIFSEQMMVRAIIAMHKKMPVMYKKKLSTYFN